MDSTKTPAALKWEKRDADIRALHHSEPDLSLRAIAARVGCSSPATVKKVLDAEAAQPPKPEVSQVKMTGGGVKVTKFVPTKITGGGVKVTKSTAVIITKPPQVTESTPQTAALSVVPTDDDVIDLKDFEVTGDDEADPDELMEMANKLYDEVSTSQLDAAWRIGELLSRAKKQKGHGEYLPWLAERFRGTRQTAAIYVKIYEEGDSPSNVMTSLHLDGVPPSINVVAKAITARRKAGKSNNLSKRDAAAMKQKTVRDTAMRKVKAASEFIRKEASRALGTGISGPGSERFECRSLC
jgi:hypothetical protein